MVYPVSGRQAAATALFLVAVAAACFPGTASSVAAEPKTVFMVDDYRYEPPAGGEVMHDDIALSLCGTRCNAISSDFASYLKPGGWRMVKITGGVELRVDLNNPFLAGQCVCVGDEYRIDWYDPATYLDRTEK